MPVSGPAVSRNSVTRGKQTRHKFGHIPACVWTWLCMLVGYPFFSVVLVEALLSYRAVLAYASIFALCPVEDKKRRGGWLSTG